MRDRPELSDAGIVLGVRGGSTEMSGVLFDRWLTDASAAANGDDIATHDNAATDHCGSASGSDSHVVYCQGRARWTLLHLAESVTENLRLDLARLRHVVELENWRFWRHNRWAARLSAP